jgi:hypothetical protein
MNSIETVIAALERNPALILPLVREMPPALLKRRPTPGAWSAHEIACHLADAQPIFFERLDLMLRDKHPRIKPFQPDSDQEDGALLKVDLDEALDRFVHDRIRLVERLKKLAPEDWQRTAEHPEYSHYSVFIMFRHMALHDLMHAYSIEELLLKKEWA